MRWLATALLFCSATSVAQYNLPPGTSSSVPDAEQRPQISPQTAALQHAEEAIRANRFEDAVGILTPFATSTQKNGRVFYDLGFAQDALDHDTEAVAAYKAAIACDGNDVPARVSLGLLLARGTDRDGAEEQLAAAVKSPGADPELLARAHRALAQIHLQAKPEQAREELLAALKLSPETPEDAALAAEIADTLKDDDAAMAAYVHALQMSPADASLAVEYARVLMRQKRFEEARTVLEAAQKAHPQNNEVLAELASEQLLEGHAAEALPLLVQLHTAQPSSAPIALLLARAYTAAGTPEKADALYTALLAASPEDPSLLAEAADHLIREKRSAEAEPLLQRALAHPETFASQQALADAAGELAFAASSKHDPETVLKALATHDAITAPTAPFTFLAATAHDTLRHTKQAADQYRLFLQQSSGKFPDQEWQAQQRLQILNRTK